MAGATDRSAPLNASPAPRVAMIIQRFRPEFSGQGIQMEQLCGALGRRRRFDAVVLTSIRGSASELETCDGYHVRRLRADLIPGFRSRSSLWMPTFGLRVLLELLRLPRVDVVHVHGLNDGLYGAYAFCRRRGVPLIFEMTLMGVDDPLSALAAHHFLASARYRAYRGCDAYVAMSRAFLPAYAAAGMPADRLHVIPQGVDTGRFRPLDVAARRIVRTELGCGPEDPLVVFVGSLIERKGVDVLLAAWAAVHERRPNARLVLVGRDEFEPASPERHFLEHQLARLPETARETVRRVGLRDDPERLLGAADAFAFPSRREGFGSAIVEAMACRVPCVVARLDGITDFVFGAPIDGPGGGSGDGVVVPQEEPEALSRALLDLLDRPDWAADVAAAGLQRARARFDLETVVAPAYEALYAGVITQGPRT
jgi:glycosyltransferase involved in cell wall biosynthesis